jgi:hypothetical protein
MTVDGGQLTVEKHLTTAYCPLSKPVACGGKLFAAALRRTVGICRTRYVARARGAKPESILIGLQRVGNASDFAAAKSRESCGQEKSDARAGQDVA